MEILVGKTFSLKYHHTRPLETCSYGVVYPQSPLNYEEDKEDAKFWDDSYKWLEKELGFYPLFLAVGSTEEDIRMTGYQNQWRKLLVTGRNHREYRKKGDIPNNVLFSFQKFPGGVFTDFNNWHIVLNSSCDNYQIPSHAKRKIFRPSFIKNDWISYANKYPCSVQLVVPTLDLRKAEMVTVRNQKTKAVMEARGFKNVQVARLLLEGNRK